MNLQVQHKELKIVIRQEIKRVKRIKRNAIDLAQEKEIKKYNKGQ